jgi:hypothetical protein
MKPAAMMLILLLVVSSAPVAVSQGGGSVSGIARNGHNQALSSMRVQLRNLDTGQLVGSTTSASNGAFSFSGLNAGNYIVEIVDAAGHVIGTSTSMAVAAGSVISNVTVAASVAGSLAGGAAAGGLGAFFASTGGILTLAGVAVSIINVSTTDDTARQSLSP